MKIDIEVAESIFKQFLSLICSSWFYILFIHLIRMLVIFGQVCSPIYGKVPKEILNGVSEY